jgi:Protein of unknown function (DUF3168)
MNLESEIQRRWAADFRLLGLVPVERVFTAVAAGSPALPYVVIERRKTKPKVRTSSGTTIDETKLRLHIRAEALAAAEEVARAVAGRLERADFPLAEGRVLDIVLVDQSHQRAGDGTWLLALDLQVTHSQTRGTAHYG